MFLLLADSATMCNTTAICDTTHKSQNLQWQALSFRTIAEPGIYAWTLCKAVVSIAHGGTYHAANKKSKQNKEIVVMAMP